MHMSFKVKYSETTTSQYNVLLVGVEALEVLHFRGTGSQVFLLNCSCRDPIS